MVMLVLHQIWPPGLFGCAVIGVAGMEVMGQWFFLLV